ncbi:hypothetical protein GCM10020220_026420 [Nonomuraea rubra]|uniref:AAA family ATPase n=1 Tax=Nonomuraea rubra TaxID=46180 RepID=UPI0031F11043
MRLHGRKIECDRLDELVATVQTGRGSSSVLVVRGEAGIGKTALLEHARGSAAGCRVAQATGVESEMELAFSGLHQLCAPLLDRLHRLPQPRRQALEAAFGLRGGTPPDRFVFGLAVLGLLADVAEQEPLICLIDDAQRLDRVSAQTLAFVARRLRTERIGLVIAVREPALRAELAGLPELEVGPLSNGDARALLDSMTPGRLDGRVRDRIVAEAQGNPLALLELPRSLTPAELAAGYTLPHTLSAGQAERSFLRRVESLPAPTRQLLLIAAAEPVGDVTLLSRAARTLSIDESAAAPAESAGLITLGTRVRFVHPLLRSAAYQAATPENRQCVHRALAEVIDPLADRNTGRGTWTKRHSGDPTRRVAAELARSAERVSGPQQGDGGGGVPGTGGPAHPRSRPGAAAGHWRRPGPRACAGGYDAALGLLDARRSAPWTSTNAPAPACCAQITFASISAARRPAALL